MCCFIKALNNRLGQQVQKTPEFWGDAGCRWYFEVSAMTQYDENFFVTSMGGTQLKEMLDFRED
jgi:hypothetical protein